MEKGIRIYASHSKAGEGVCLYVYPLTIRNISRFRIHVLSHSCLFYGSKKERERRDAQDIMIKNAGANPSLSVCAPDRNTMYKSRYISHKRKDNVTIRKSIIISCPLITFHYIGFYLIRLNSSKNSSKN